MPRQFWPKPFWPKLNAENNRIELKTVKDRIKTSDSLRCLCKYDWDAANLATPSANGLIAGERQEPLGCGISSAKNVGLRGYILP